MIRAKKPELPPGRRYILLFTFPNTGNKYAAGERDGQLAFIPIEGDNLPGVLTWETMEQVHNFLQDYKKRNGALKYRALFALKMSVGQMQLSN